MFTFGDGSVRWLDEAIEFNLYQRLAIRDTVRGSGTLPAAVGGGRCRRPSSGLCRGIVPARRA